MRETEYNNGCYHILLHNGIYEMNNNPFTHYNWLAPKFAG